MRSAIIFFAATFAINQLILAAPVGINDNSTTGHLPITNPIERRIPNQLLETGISTTVAKSRADYLVDNGFPGIDKGPDELAHQLKRFFDTLCNLEDRRIEACNAVSALGAILGNSFIPAYTGNIPNTVDAALRLVGMSAWIVLHFHRPPKTGYYQRADVKTRWQHISGQKYSFEDWLPRALSHVREIVSPWDYAVKFPSPAPVPLDPTSLVLRYFNSDHRLQVEQDPEFGPLQQFHQTAVEEKVTGTFLHYVLEALELVYLVNTPTPTVKLLVESYQAMFLTLCVQNSVSKLAIVSLTKSSLFGRYSSDNEVMTGSWRMTKLISLGNQLKMAKKPTREEHLSFQVDLITRVFN